MVPIFGVCSAVDLIANRQNHRQVLLNWLLASAVAATVAGWFFVSNFRHLYFYYVVWNQDANARLSLSESVRHLGFAMHHIGLPLLFVLVLIALYTCAQSLRRCGTGLKKRLNWPPLLFSTVPLGYLVLSGSGLNPFVSIVGVSGIMLFLLSRSIPRKFCHPNRSRCGSPPHYFSPDASMRSAASTNIPAMYPLGYRGRREFVTSCKR